MKRSLFLFLISVGFLQISCKKEITSEQIEPKSNRLLKLFYDSDLIKEEYSYENNNLLTINTYSNSKIFLNQQIERDKKGNIEKIYFNPVNGKKIEYKINYNSSGQIASVDDITTPYPKVWQFSYDSDGKISQVIQAIIYSIPGQSVRTIQWSAGNVTQVKEVDTYDIGVFTRLKTFTYDTKANPYYRDNTDSFFMGFFANFGLGGNPLSGTLHLSKNNPTSISITHEKQLWIVYKYSYDYEDSYPVKRHKSLEYRDESLKASPLGFQQTDRFVY